MNKNDLFVPCTTHAKIGFAYACVYCTMNTLGKMAEEIVRLDNQWEERLNGNFDTEYNRATIIGEHGTLVNLITHEQIPEDFIYLVGDDGKTVGAIRTDPSGTEPSGSDATPAAGDRGTEQREDSVGRRRRRQIFDGSGILHEEGGHQ